MATRNFMGKFFDGFENFCDIVNKSQETLHPNLKSTLKVHVNKKIHDMTKSEIGFYCFGNFTIEQVYFGSTKQSLQNRQRNYPTHLKQLVTHPDTYQTIWASCEAHVEPSQREILESDVAFQIRNPHRLQILNQK